MKSISTSASGFLRSTGFDLRERRLGAKISRGSSCEGRQRILHPSETTAIFVM
jgi:hypothetical protein